VTAVRWMRGAAPVLLLAMAAGCTDGAATLPAVAVEPADRDLTVRAQGELVASEALPVAIPPSIRMSFNIAWMIPEFSNVQAGEVIARFDDAQVRLDRESTALNIAKEQNLSRISDIRIRMGELQQIDLDAFSFSVKSCMEGHDDLLGKVKVDIKKEPAEFECRVCGTRWGFEDVKKMMKEDEFEFVHFVPEIAHTYIRCTRCKSPDFQVVKGRGVWLDSVTGEQN